MGVNHRNEFNYFNLSCDVMEPFRPIVDMIVYNNKEQILDRDYKYKLIDSLNQKVIVNEKEYYVSNAIELYVKSIAKALEINDIENILDVQLI